MPHLEGTRFLVNGFTCSIILDLLHKQRYSLTRKFQQKWSCVQLYKCFARDQRFNWIDKPWVICILSHNPALQMRSCHARFALYPRIRHTYFLISPIIGQPLEHILEKMFRNKLGQYIIKYDFFFLHLEGRQHFAFHIFCVFTRDLSWSPFCNIFEDTSSGVFYFFNIIVR